MVSVGRWGMGAFRLLMVDDNAVFRRLVAQYLGQTGMFARIDEAPGPQAAVCAAHTHQPQIILLDLNLPGANGLDLIPALRAAAPGVKILVLSLWEAEQYRAAAQSAGADAFVGKSSVHARLMGAITALLPTAG